MQSQEESCLSFMSSTCSQLTETRRESGLIVSTSGRGRKQEVVTRISPRPPACLAYGEIRYLRLNVSFSGDMTTGIQRRKSEATTLTKSAEWIIIMPRTVPRLCLPVSMNFRILEYRTRLCHRDYIFELQRRNSLHIRMALRAAVFYAHPSHTELQGDCDGYVGIRNRTWTAFYIKPNVCLLKLSQVQSSAKSDWN